MRIEINMETCLNSGQCAYMQPEIFDVDDAGVPTILVSGDLTDDQIAMAQEAADVCPSQSITLVDD
ncbi:MAG: ferredoxin [Actinomycetota bacterium]